MELPRGQFRGSSVNEPPRMPHASFCAPGSCICVANSLLNKRMGTWFYSFSSFWIFFFVNFVARISITIFRKFVWLFRQVHQEIKWFVASLSVFFVKWIRILFYVVPTAADFRHLSYGYHSACVSWQIKRMEIEIHTYSHKNVFMSRSDVTLINIINGKVKKNDDVEYTISLNLIIWPK